MKYTNKYDLPEEVFNVLSKDRYNGGNSTDYSVTTLKTPPRIVQLGRRHSDEIEGDVMDNLWSMFGTMAHNMLEEHGSDDSFTEERVYLNILDRNISGAIDHYKDGIITDYKVTSAWSLVYGSRIKDWEEQLNMYAHLLTSAGKNVRQIRIVAILRDWDKNKAKQGGGYPNAPIQIIPITLWEDDKTARYILQQVQYQILNEDCADEDLWECSSEEMWEQPSKYALMKEGGKRAVKVEDSRYALHQYCIGQHLSTPQIVWDEEGETNLIEGYYVEVRKGKRTRCEEYCDVAPFCNIYQEYIKEKNNDNNN